MLDEGIATQLRQVFGSLSSSYKLVVAQGNNPKQAELLELAQGLAETSPKLEAVVEGEVEKGVRLSIVRDGEPTGSRLLLMPRHSAGLSERTTATASFWKMIPFRIDCGCYLLHRIRLSPLSTGVQCS